ADNQPDCKGLWEYGDLNTFLPDYITKSLLEAFPEFGKNIKGYNAKNTLLLGLESRTSSPVKICRGEDLQSVNVSGLYPCGEGAGYAGGITSAAMDGLKVADKILSTI
ncbi:MAG: FAD-dependent oxidoreductase, partial [Lachnospiraceae bacterium]|nr:FAD-dependent oxidoreductase [Lachnospiraceae bacterium]